MPPIARPAAALTLALMLAGCAAFDPGDPSAPYSTIPKGAVLVLKVPITIPPGRTRVFFFDGEPASGGSSEVPVCGLEVRRLDPEAAQTLAPGRFPIKRSERFSTEVVRADPNPRGIRWRLASADQGLPMVYEGYHFWLDAREQPNLLRLTCIGVFADLPKAQPPTLTEIVEALGAIAAIESP